MDQKTIWDKLWSDSNWKISSDQIARQKILLSLQSEISGKRVIELGIGTGFDSVWFAKKGASVTGLDLSVKSIEVCKKNFYENGVMGKFILGDVHALPIKDGSFDVVYSAGLLEHFIDPNPVITEMIRITKIDGSIICFVPQTISWWTIRKKREIKQNKWFAGWETNYSFWKLRKIFNRPTLRFKKIKGFHTYITPWDLYETYYFYKKKGWLLRQFDGTIISKILGKEIGILVLRILARKSNRAG